MGCDYYICKCLQIRTSTKLFTIELERQRGYFQFYLDEDHPNYEEEFEKYVKNELQPHMAPIEIFSSGKFVNITLENKYKSWISRALDEHDVANWNEVVDIYKIETRYERM